MRLSFIIYYLLFIISPLSLSASALDEAPVAYGGRFRPMEAYARLWLQETYGRQSIKPTHADAFGAASLSASELVWQLALQGYGPFKDAPLFYVRQASLKAWLNLDLRTSHFSHSALVQAFAEHPDEPIDESIRDAVHDLKVRVENPPQLRMLASRQHPGEWRLLSALQDSDNFTPYPNALFATLRSSYLQRDALALASGLVEGYQQLAGEPLKRTHGRILYYPTERQLKAELLYYRLPLVPATMALYLLAAFLLFLTERLQSRRLEWLALGCLITGFAVHTFLLALRCYILQRPPVSNMFETALYVPWISLLVGLIWRGLGHSNLVAGAAAIGSTIILAILQVTHLNDSLETVQAVLDSQYWLIVHVLMIVGSYGVFLVAGLLGHLYLVASLLPAYKETLSRLGKAILHTLYLGTALLIPGTILGGIWAAQSWGRFWDWDPKESWAFITSCVYLIVIHGYRFGKISYYGLAIGSIAGLLAVSFTWYGVNYILGTGLHSYGFGSGGEFWYYLYVVGELAFIAFVSAATRVSGEDNKITR